MSQNAIRFFALKSKDGVKLLEFHQGIEKAALLQHVNEFKETVQTKQSDKFLHFLRSKGIEVDFVITGGVIELN